MTKEGRCHICLKTGILNEEHIPPRCCGNKLPVKMSYIFEIEKKEKKEIISQNGSKFFSICEHCNSFLGLNYDYELGKLYEKVEKHYKGNIARFPLKIKCKINKLTRSVIGKLLALSPVIDETSFEQNMREYLLNDKLTKIPNMNLYLRQYLFEDYVFARNALPIGLDHFCKVFDCLYFPPLAFLLTKDLETNDDFMTIQKNDYKFLDLFKYTTDNIEDEVELVLTTDMMRDNFTHEYFSCSFPLNGKMMLSLAKDNENYGTSIRAHKYVPIKQTKK